MMGISITTTKPIKTKSSLEMAESLKVHPNRIFQRIHNIVFVRRLWNNEATYTIRWNYQPLLIASILKLNKEKQYV